MENEVHMDITAASLSAVADRISDVTRKWVLTQDMSVFDTMSIADLQAGMYIVNCSNDGVSLGSFRLIKK